jgi:hypothetical protein
VDGQFQDSWEGAVKRPEEKLQGSLIDFLRRAMPTGIVFHPANGGHRDKRVAAKLKWQGVLAGIPDIIVLIDGRAFGMEVKAPNGRLSDAQEGIAALFERNAIPWAEIRSLEQAEAFLTKHGVPLMARVAA